MEESLILREVTAGYAASGTPELAAVDLVVNAGEIVCLLGPNGAGKTTAVRVASGLLAPRSGEVLLLGTPLSRRSRAEVARLVAVVEQSQEVSAGFTVRDVVAMGRAPHQGGWMREADADRRVVDEALARCDLVALADRSARALSGGEQKRVAVARALVQQPKVLLLDEPGAFLDVRHQLDLYDLVSEEVAERRMACLVVMHDLNIAAQFADRVILIKRGRVIASGSVADVMTPAILRETFDTDLHCGRNEETQLRFFLPRRRPREKSQR